MTKSLSFWLLFGIFGSLLELGVFLGLVTGIITFSVFFLLLLLFLQKKLWSTRLLLAASLILGLSSLNWTQFFFSQTIIAALLFSWSEFYQEDRRNRRYELALLILLFLTFVTFYVFRAALPASYGLILLGEVIVTFFLTRIYLETVFPQGTSLKLPTLLATALLTEIMTVLYFLPQGYLSLALIALISYIMLTRLLIFSRFGFVNVRRVCIEIGSACAVLVLILFSSGIRPRP